MKYFKPSKNAMANFKRNYPKFSEEKIRKEIKLFDEVFTKNE